MNPNSLWFSGHRVDLCSAGGQLLPPRAKVAKPYHLHPMQTLAHHNCPPKLLLPLDIEVAPDGRAHFCPWRVPPTALQQMEEPLLVPMLIEVLGVGP